ncbi:hypothetical protein GW17_00038794 [Ensete ventricosum]|nr:hypothetical protein GW17_00038794 [Ensete ventricosum]
MARRLPLHEDSSLTLADLFKQGSNFLLVGLEARFAISICTARIARFAISIYTARYGRYIPVHQATGMRTARYRAVPPKIDRRRSIEGEIDHLRSIEEEKGKKKKRKKRKKKRSRNNTAPSSPARRRRPRPQALFLPHEETERLPARGEISRRRRCRSQLLMCLLQSRTSGHDLEMLVLVRWHCGCEGYSSTRPRRGIFLHGERSDIHVSLSPANDPSLTLILPLEGLNLLAVTGLGSEVIIREDLERHGPLLGEVVEVARDLRVPHQKPWQVRRDVAL